MKKIITLILAIVFAITGCHSKETVSQEQSSVASESILAENNEQKEFLQLSEKEVVAQTLNILQENLADLDPKIMFDEDNHVINVIFVAPEGTTNAIIMNPEAIKENWLTLCNWLKKTSEASYQFALENGHEIACTIMVLNDSNQENALFATMNGIEILNVLN